MKKSIQLYNVQITRYILQSTDDVWILDGVQEFDERGKIMVSPYPFYRHSFTALHAGRGWPLKEAVFYYPLGSPPLAYENRL